MPHAIIAESVRYLYFTRSEGFPDTFDYGHIRNLPSRDNWDSVISGDMKDVRLAAFQLSASALLYFFLHWDSTPNLDELDARVTSNIYDDRDFSTSILTVFGVSSCFNCTWHAYTLHIPRDIGYPEKQNLWDQKLNERIERGTVIGLCPNCNAEMTRFVTKIFGQPTP